jgi:hypothetical protein
MTLYKHTRTLLSLLLASILLLSGCSTHSQQVDVNISQQSLLNTCPETLPSDYGTSGKDWLLMAEEWSSIYHTCKTRHNALVEFIKAQKGGE